MYLPSNGYCICLILKVLGVLFRVATASAFISDAFLFLRQYPFITNNQKTINYVCFKLYVCMLTIVL